MKCSNMDNQTEKMRQRWAVKNGVSLSKEFTDAEKQKQLDERIKERELFKKYALEPDERTVNRRTWWGEAVHIFDFEPIEKIYPPEIKPTPIPFDGVDTIASVFGIKEKLFILR